MNEFLLYCISSLRLSGSADCYCVLRKDGTEIPSWTVIPFQGFKEEITLVNRNTIKKPQEPKSAIHSSGISGCPSAFFIEIGINGVYSKKYVRRDDSVESVLRNHLYETLKDKCNEDLIKEAVLQCDNRVLNNRLTMGQSGVINKRLDCASF